MISDQRRAAVELEPVVVKDDRRFADLDLTAGGQGHRHLYRCSVVSGSVCRAEILEPECVAFLADFGVESRRKGIGNTYVTPRGASDGRPQAR